MKKFCVVYIVCGIHYRYRCVARNKREAKSMCKRVMQVKGSDIVEAYEED